MREYSSLTQEEKDLLVQLLIKTKTATVFSEVMVAGWEIDKILDYGNPTLINDQIKVWKEQGENKTLEVEPKKEFEKIKIRGVEPRKGFFG